MTLEDIERMKEHSAAWYGYNDEYLCFVRVLDTTHNFFAVKVYIFDIRLGANSDEITHTSYFMGFDRCVYPTMEYFKKRGRLQDVCLYAIGEYMSIGLGEKPNV